MQGEPGLFPHMHPVAAQAAGLKTVSQLFHLRCEFIRVKYFQCKSVAQQQGIDARLVL